MFRKPIEVYTQKEKEQLDMIKRNLDAYDQRVLRFFKKIPNEHNVSTDHDLWLKTQIESNDAAKEQLKRLIELQSLSRLLEQQLTAGAKTLQTIRANSGDVFVNISTPCEQAADLLKTHIKYNESLDAQIKSIEEQIKSQDLLLEQATTLIMWKKANDMLIDALTQYEIGERIIKAYTNSDLDELISAVVHMRDEIKNVRMAFSELRSLTPDAEKEALDLRLEKIETSHQWLEDRFGHLTVSHQSTQKEEKAPQSSMSTMNK